MKKIIIPFISLFIACQPSGNHNSFHEYAFEVEAIESPAEGNSSVPNFAVGADESIYMSWIEKKEGVNELRFDFLDRLHEVIWRSVYTNSYKWYLEEIQSLLGLRSKKNHSQQLKLNFECRPYHLGWILYAFNDKH